MTALCFLVIIMIIVLKILHTRAILGPVWQDSAGSVLCMANLYHRFFVALIKQSWTWLLNWMFLVDKLWFRQRNAQRDSKSDVIWTEKMPKRDSKAFSHYTLSSAGLLNYWFDSMIPLPHTHILLPPGWKNKMSSKYILFWVDANSYEV